MLSATHERNETVGVLVAHPSPGASRSMSAYETLPASRPKSLRSWERKRVRCCLTRMYHGRGLAKRIVDTTRMMLGNCLLFS